MPASARHHVASLEEYFAVERNSPGRHEFFDGQIYVMAGGSHRHDYLETRALLALGRRLGDGPCLPMTSNRRIATPDGLYTYADGSIFCGRIETGPEQTSTNPVLLIEVLSDSTREYDRGEKLARVQTIPSLRHVLLIEQHHVEIEHWQRTEAAWVRRRYSALDASIELPDLGLTLPVGEIYEGLDRVPR
ncbi:MAG: Uma2 family endonuclease [Deltaproteobacteria bacterium]|nr:Uma2 family endonuclease [Deltaproteobacteria bacterium]